MFGIILIWLLAVVALFISIKNYFAIKALRERLGYEILALRKEMEK